MGAARIAVICVALSACSQVFGLDAPGKRHADASIDSTTDGSSEDAQPGARRKSITIAGDKIPSDLINFPLWIDITDADLMTTDNVSFVDDMGTLDFELTQRNPTIGRLRGWVRAPQLTQGAQYRFYLILTPGPDGTGTNGPAVFSNMFAAVWHLDDALTTTTTVVDSTGQRNGSTATGALTAADSIGGTLGTAIDFDSSTKLITFAQPYANDDPHTISAWVNARSATNFDCIISMGTGTTNQARWLHSVWMSPNVGLGFFNNDWNVSPAVDLQNAGWKLVHWTFGLQGSRIYINGALVAGPHLHGMNINTTGSSGYIGWAPANFGNDTGINGTLDEVRLATIERSAGWIATEYANQSSPATFFTVGPAEPVP